MPPSPWLSARITSARYLIEMMMISAQKAIDATPSALVSMTGEVLVLERLAERVERARADVAEHDAERAEAEGCGGGARRCVPVAHRRRTVVATIRPPGDPA